MGQGGSQIGRDAEREQVASVLREAESGHPSALLVSGEPGIGKTSLVTEVTSGPAAARHTVLWGRCLRFGAESSPYLPFTQALTQWHRRADAAERVRVLTGAEHLGSIAPSLGAVTHHVDTTRVVPLVAAVLDRIAERSPLTLVVDDLQWADGSSLDLLAYLVAGLDTGERLSLVLTYRDPELLAVGHPLHGWLADVRRLPAVSELRLPRLGLPETEELVTRLRGSEATTALAADIFTRSRGNPYLVRLLATSTTPEGEAPSPADENLNRELLSSWHRLPAPARELLQLLAVSGRPVAAGILEQLWTAHGRPQDHVAPALAEAAAAGLTTTTTDGDVWFHHPLVAEVVATTLTPADRRYVHKQYVKVLETSEHLPMASRAAHLALHHEGAGDLDQAFSWSLRAADEAAAVRGYAEEFDHLHRACRLWEDVGDDARAAVTDRLDLWTRTSDSAWSSGEHLLAVRLREEAIGFTGDSVDPVRAVRLRLPLPAKRQFCGLDVQASVEATRATLELAEESCPGTPEHVQALARHAHAEMWSEDLMGGRAALDAERIARRIGSPEALAWALCARTETTPTVGSITYAAEARALAGDVGDAELQGWAARASANRLNSLGRDAEAGRVLLTTFRQLVATGSVHDAMYANPCFGAWFQVESGEWEEAREVLRLALSLRLPAHQSAETRGVAALLALRTGDVGAGRTHLARARELEPPTPLAGHLLQLIEVEAQSSLGRHAESLGLSAWIMPDNVLHDPPGADEILVVAARAAGDMAEEPPRRAEAVTLLDRVEQLRGPEASWFEQTSGEDLIHPAREALFVADRARCHGDGDTATLWREAVSACDAAGMVWHEALASYQLARALLRERHARSEAAVALRHAARIATELGAAPVLRDCEELSRQAHLSLAELAPDDALSSADGPLASLTPREREVLAHLVAGRTYAEIAEALFISEKTVSVHVSNLLRKTGTRSRVEVADLVRRTSATP